MAVLSILKWWLATLKWAANYSDVGIWMKIRLLADYLRLYRDKGLTRNEYQNFEFEKQTDEFRQSFLGLHEQRYYLDYLNPVKYYSLARNKYLTHKILERTGVRKAELYCYYQPEGSVMASDEIANSCKEVYRILSEKHVTECVIKTTESSHGVNVIVVKQIEYMENDCRMTLFNGNGMMLSGVLGRDALIFESVIKQTEQLAVFNPSSVNTVRFMTTLYPDNKARLVATFIKIGRKGKCVDNAGEGGNVDACINKDSGRLESVIQFNGWRKLKKIARHPDNEALLEGVTIENWKEIVEDILHYQECFPYVKAAGWDVAITNDGPVVVEVNDFWDRTGQLFLQRGWRQEIRECYLAWRQYWIVSARNECYWNENNSLLSTEGKEYELCRQTNKLDITHLRGIASK